jgi:hypothetical protein
MEKISLRTVRCEEKRLPYPRGSFCCPSSQEIGRNTYSLFLPDQNHRSAQAGLACHLQRQWPNRSYRPGIVCPRCRRNCLAHQEIREEKNPAGSMPPGRTLQEIRRMCIDLRLTFFPGMSTPQGRQIACVQYGNDGWRFENSEKVISRQELESYLSRYGMIRSASR